MVIGKRRRISTIRVQPVFLRHFAEHNPFCVTEADREGFAAPVENPRIQAAPAVFLRSRLEGIAGCIRCMMHLEKTGASPNLKTVPPISLENGDNSGDGGRDQPEKRSWILRGEERAANLFLPACFSILLWPGFAVAVVGFAVFRPVVSPSRAVCRRCPVWRVRRGVQPSQQRRVIESVNNGWRRFSYQAD